ncbi:hypothetical protein BJV78DRAFT_1186955 [Lactifluus subvellereus]|nr:hypothetical protein BJV78DRAFT_1186955 [Lactifluus subvellereus]
MSSDGRSRRRELVDEAYNLQVKAGLMGAAKYGAFSLGSAILAQHTWPAFRRQTLPFKGFLISIFTIYGLVSSADTALLSHENRQRLTENELRREARIDLARRGLVATESQIMKWRDEHQR